MWVKGWIAVALLREKPFAAGVVLGVICSVLVLGVTGLAIVMRGVRVDIDIESFATMVRDEVRGEAERRLPEMLLEIEGRVPALVETALSERMTTATISMADVTIDLPDSVLELVQDQMQSVVEQVLYEILDQFDDEQMATDLGDQAYGLLKTNIAAQVADAAVSYRLFGRLKVPVTLNFR